jgi:hypothetical protein
MILNEQCACACACTVLFFFCLIEKSRNVKAKENDACERKVRGRQATKEATGHERTLQLGDRPCLDATLDLFKSYNEPHYPGYDRCDLASLLESKGLVCLQFENQALSFTKPYW